MTRSAAARLSWFIFGLGVAATAALYATRGPVAGRSAAAGAVVALGNWYLLRFIIGRVLDGRVRRKAAFSVLLFAKMGALIGVVFALLHSGFVQPIAFTIGVSSLALGTLLGSCVHIFTAQVAEDG
jgi:hypothetical protein